MKWKRRSANRDCASQPLAELIHDELDEQECERLATHLSDCETCQQRLTILAADSQWWLDANRWLDPATGDIDTCNASLADEDFTDDDSHYSNPEQGLLASGLLAPSDKAGVIGTLDRYEVQSVIGAGGTGIVLKAIDADLNRTVAIKLLSPVLAASGAARRRFAREGQAVAAVAHENVVAVHQVEGGGRLPFLVMQYIDGDSLQDLVVRDGPLDITTALRMTAQIASALSAAHDQGLVHRDVKPANILVGAAGQRVWITDFGLARAVDDASLTRTGFIAGTPHYMSPEQARGETVRGSSDLFGLGSVLYFMLTGRPPFRAERTLAILNRICNEPHRPVREVNPEVPPAIAELVDRLLSKSAAERIVDASSVRTHCLRLLAALTEPDGDLSQVTLHENPPAPEPIDEPVKRRVRLRRSGSWAIAILLLVGLSVVVGAVLGPDENAGRNDPNTDNTNWPEDAVAVRSEAPAMADADVPDSSANLVAAAEGLFAAGTAVASTTPQLGEPAPIALASGVEPPPMNIGQFTPPTAQLDLPPPPIGEVVTTNGESFPWLDNLNQLRASFALLETQFSQPPTILNSGIPRPIEPDPFGEELRRIDDSLRALEAQPALVK